MATENSICFALLAKGVEVLESRFHLEQLMINSDKMLLRVFWTLKFVLCKKSQKCSYLGNLAVTLIWAPNKLEFSMKNLHCVCYTFFLIQRSPFYLHEALCGLVWFNSITCKKKQNQCSVIIHHDIILCVGYYNL